MMLHLYVSQILSEIWLNQNSLEGDRPVSNQSLVGVSLVSLFFTFVTYVNNKINLLHIIRKSVIGHTT